MNMRFHPNTLIAALAVAYLAACGSSGSGSDSTPPPTGSAPQPTSITKPTTVNLYPSESTTDTARLRVIVTSVGTANVNMVLGFDTGSAGVTLWAQSIFPASMVSSTGFVFPAGQTSMTYNGITVTNLQGTRSYGTDNSTVEHGNLGFAQLTFGDASGTITTQVMPIFLFYVNDEGTNNNDIVPDASWQGWFGVASTNQTIEVAGSTAPAGGFGGCATDSTVTCSLVSAMKYIDYGSQVNAGFLLSPAPLQTCEITTAGSCQPQPMLTVGLDASVESGFSTTPLVCPPNGYTGPASIAGYPVCQKSVQVTVTASGADAGSYTGYAVFDTGTPDFYLSTPSDSVLATGLDPGSTVTIATLSGFNYAYTADETTATNTQIDLGGNSASIIGIQYFTTNSFLLDFTAGIVGWK